MHGTFSQTNCWCLVDLTLLVISRSLPRTRANEETLKVLMHQPASRGATKAGRETLCTIGRLNLNAERAEHIDAPRGPRLAVLLPLCHWRRKGAVNQPMTTLDL